MFQTNVTTLVISLHLGGFILWMTTEIRKFAWITDEIFKVMLFWLSVWYKLPLLHNLVHLCWSFSSSSVIGNCVSFCMTNDSHKSSWWETTISMVCFFRDIILVHVATNMIGLMTYDSASLETSNKNEILTVGPFSLFFLCLL